MHSSARFARGVSTLQRRVPFQRPCSHFTGVACRHDPSAFCFLACPVRLLLPHPSHLLHGNVGLTDICRSFVSFSALLPFCLLPVYLSVYLPVCLSARVLVRVFVCNTGRIRCSTSHEDIGTTCGPSNLLSL